MTSNELLKKLDRLSKNLPMDLSLNILGMDIVLTRYGLPCKWTLIEVEKDYETVYKLRRMGETRKEYFLGHKARQYEGYQMCFVEALDFIVTDPTYLDSPDRLAKDLGLDEKMARKYVRFLQRLKNRTGLFTSPAHPGIS